MTSCFQAIALSLPFALSALASKISILAGFLTSYYVVLSACKSSLRDFSFSLKLKFVMKFAYNEGRDLSIILMISPLSMQKPKFSNHLMYLIILTTKGLTWPLLVNLHPHDTFDTTTHLTLTKVLYNLCKSRRMGGMSISSF